MDSARVQGDIWGAAAEDWVALQEAMAMPLREAMLDAAGVSAGTRFLDAGCGGGGACLLAAGRGAEVSGIDAAGALIAIARRRVPGGEFRVGDLEAMPYPPAVFQAVIAANAVPHVGDPVAALRELRRVCSAEGRVVVSTWGPPEDCQMRDIFRAVVGVLPAPPPDEGPFAFSGAGGLEGLAGRAGLQVADGGNVECPFEYPDVETFWRAQRSAGPMQGVARAVGEARLREAVVSAAQPYRTGRGGVRLLNRFRYVVLTP